MTATRVDLDALPVVPRDAEGPVFRAPWEAQLVRDKGLIAASELESRAEAWVEAARRTPHGPPVALDR